MDVWIAIASVITVFLTAFGIVAMIFIAAAVIAFETEKRNGDE